MYATVRREDLLLSALVRLSSDWALLTMIKLLICEKQKYLNVVK